MNTTRIGNQFEEKVYKLFSEELSQGRLYFNPELCKIFNKKGYFSKDRQKEIVVDISIEVYLPGEEKWSILVIIECKDYKHSPVPVDDVEEFNSKLQQLAGANVKGIIVSTNAYQEGAINYARARGIGVARILDESNLKWILTRAATSLITYDRLEQSRLNIYWGLTRESYYNDHIDFYSTIGDNFTSSAKQFVKLLLQGVIDQIQNFTSVFTRDQKEETLVPFISKDKIEQICSNILDEINYRGYEVDLNRVIDSLKKRKNLQIEYVTDLGYDALGFEILGKIMFNPTIISVSKKSHDNNHRLKFTLAHEIGHSYLNHCNYIYSEYYSTKEYEEKASVVNIEEIKRMEWQANYFASSLLLPQKAFVNEFLKLLETEGLKDRSFGLLFVDNQQCNLNSFYKITNKLRYYFQVSRKAVEIRLKTLGLLNDSR